MVDERRRFADTAGQVVPRRARPSHRSSRFRVAYASLVVSASCAPVAGSIARLGLIDEWHVDLRKPKGGSDIGKAGLSWEDGGWQPFHHRQGGPRCVILTEVPCVIR